MSDLTEIARWSLYRLVKATDHERRYGDVSYVGGPSVPPEQIVPPRPRPLRAVVEDALEMLEEGLNQAETASARTQLRAPRSQEPPYDNERRESQQSPRGEVEVEARGDGFRPYTGAGTEMNERKVLSRSIALLKKAVGGGDIPLSVKALIHDRDGRLLILRDAYSSYWDLPGGHVQSGELLDEALRREVYEETGLEISGSEQLDMQMMQLGQEELKPVIFYDVQIVGGQPRLSEEHLGYQWADDESIQAANLGLFKPVIMNINKENGGGEGGGDVMTGADFYTPAISGRRKVTNARGHGTLVTGEDLEEMPIGEKIYKMMKGVDSTRLPQTDLMFLQKATAAGQFVIAGYASPVVVDQEGHRVSHEALAKDLPRFMADDGKYANVNILHSNLTVGKVLPEYVAPSGKTYKTEVDDIGLYVVAEIRTDKAAPKAIQEVIDDIESGKLRSFSISGNAENPVFTCDERRCFYDINDVNLFEITVCKEGVNQDAHFDIVSGNSYR